MKVEQVSDHIWSLRSNRMLPIRVWFVADEEGVTLVDAGMNYMAARILRTIDDLDQGPLKQILLTHGHGDHTGAVNRIMESLPVQVFAHETEIPYLQGDQIYPRRRKAETNLLKGLAKPLQKNSQGELLRIAGLKPIFTPGHSPGHVAYYHEEDKVLLAGDMFVTRRGKLRPPMKMFTANMEEAIRSGLMIRDIQPLKMEVCHGHPVDQPANQLDQFEKKYAGK